MRREASPLRRLFASFRSVRVDPTGVAIVQHEPGEEELPPSVISRLLGERRRQWEADRSSGAPRLPPFLDSCAGAGSEDAACNICLAKCLAAVLAAPGGPSKTPGRILLASRRADGTFSYTCAATSNTAPPRPHVPERDNQRCFRSILTPGHSARCGRRLSLPGHCWTRTVTRPSFPRPDAKALLARLGGLPWTDEGLPQMTDVLWTAGGAAVQQTPADVVRALTTED